MNGKDKNRGRILDAKRMRRAEFRRSRQQWSTVYDQVISQSAGGLLMALKNPHYWKNGNMGLKKANRCLERK